MEENNNNENQVKETVKNESKKWGMKLAKPFLKYIIIAIIGFMGILLAVGLLHLIEYWIQNTFASLLDAFSAEDSESATATTSSVASESVIYIDENTGYYKLKVKDFSKKILEELKEKKVNNNVMGFNANEVEGEEIDEKELQDMIDKYIKAEVQTMFPKTGKTGFFQNDDVDGKIIIKRASVETGEIEELKYKKYSEFCSMVQSGNENVLKYFSLNPEDFKLCIARKSGEARYYNIDSSGNQTEITSMRDNGSIIKEELNYQSYMQNYAVPLNFFVTLHVIAQDKEFMEDVVDMATGEGKDEPLVLTYVETQEVYETEYHYSGNYTKEIDIYNQYDDEYEEYQEYGEEYFKDILNENDIAYERDEDIDIDNDNVNEYLDDDVEYNKEVVKINSGTLQITKADTWLKTSSKTINPRQTEPTGNSDNTYEKKNETYGPDIYAIQAVIEEGTEESTGEATEPEIIKYMKKFESILINERIISNSSSVKYTIVDNGSEIVVDDFVDLIRSYPKVENNFSTAPSNIFYLLQQRENTQKLEKIMRYVLYKLNDIDYGVTEADLDFLLVDTFISTTGGIYGGGSAEETVWFSLRAAGYSEYAVAGVMGNLRAESGFRTNNLENAFEIGGQYSLGHTDVSYTEAVNNGSYTREQFISDHTAANCGAGYGLAQWTYYSRKAGLYDLAKSKGASIDDPAIQVEFLLSEISGYNDSAWIDAETPEAAARAFCLGFERPASTDTTVREQYAREYYEEFQGRTAGSFETNSDSNLYTGYYTSTRGRRFTILNQNTISGWGAKCNRAAGAIIASGYTNEDATTLINTMNTTYAQAGDPIVPQNNFFNLYGLELTSDSGSMGVSQYSEVLRNQLQSGGYAMIWLNKGEYYGASGTRWTGEIHWVAILDYKVEDGQEKIVVADWRGAGWYSIGEFKHGISRIALINEM